RGAARPVADLPAPDPLRADHADRRRAARLARPVRPPAARGTAMTVDERLDALRELVQRDPANRGLRADPNDNLITRTVGDFAAACRSIAGAPRPSVCVVPGFYTPPGQPPACETDGPLGAVFLARALSALRVPVLLVADASMGGAI